MSQSINGRANVHIWEYLNGQTNNEKAPVENITNSAQHSNKVLDVSGGQYMGRMCKWTWEL
jgi:hypothetical protein